MKHVELHNHTTYSVLDGKSDTMEYATRAAELGMSHLAITDHGTTSGWREFQRSTKETGIKPILGIEAYLTADRTDRRTAAKRQDGTSIYNHITLLAMDAKGAQNLEAMNKVAWEEGYFYKPRMDFELLEEYNEGIIALSGCMSGMIAKKFLNGMPNQSRSDAVYFKEVFGDRFYMEVMESNSTELNNYLIDLAKELNIKPVVTSDCHMAREEDLPIADAMLILNTNPKYNSAAEASAVELMSMMETFNYLYPDRQMSFQEFELWLHSYDEHVANLAKQGIGNEPVDNTMEIASRISDYDYYEALDTLPPVEGVENPMEELRRLTYEGLRERGMDNKVNRKRIELELDTIEKKELATYFLIEKDFVDYARDNDILVGYGRGSAVSYLTNYCLGITKIDPMPYNLLPERFLSMDREDPADIDTDLSVEGRYKVKEYAQRKYTNASNIATVGYYKDKSSIKAAAKVFKANFSETTAFTNKFETIEEFEASSETADYRKRYPHLIKLAKGLNGRIQNFGMHAGGIVLSKEPIERYAPLQTAKDPSNDAKDRVPVVALDMRELADMGFVKYDLLGLRTLSIIEDTLKLIKERRGIDIDIENIDITDKNVYDMISSGHTAGVFQAEASASTKVILAMGGVKDFNELVASNALVRPGAANSEVGATYLRGKLEGEYEYSHPDMKWFTEETYSAILYQEQQLLLCEHIAGMSKANANKVRKAVSKKIPEDLAIWKDEFIEGASKKVGQQRAEEIWTDLEASADYAFAKAHAVGYSMLSYLTAYLKYYYSIEFLASSIKWMKSSNKADRMKLLRYMLEAKRMGIRIMLPHVNKSAAEIEIRSDKRGDYIQLGLSNIKGVGARTAQPLVNKAPWESYAQMQEDPSVRANVLKALNAVGAVAFEDNPRTGEERDNLFEYLSLPVVNHAALPPEVHSQFTSLLYHDDVEITLTMGLVAGETRKNHWRRVDIADEDSSVSLFVSPQSPIEVGQVYVFLLSESNVARYIKTDELEESGKFWEFLNEQTPLNIPEDAARVVAFNSRRTKKGDRMAEVIFSDQYKQMFSALVFPKDFMKHYSLLKDGATVMVDFSRTSDGTRFVTNVKEIR